MAPHSDQFNPIVRQKIVDMPAELLFAAFVSGDSLCEILHCASGVDILSRFEMNEPKRADLKFNRAADLYHQLVAS